MIKINTDHIENITKWSDCSIEIAENEILKFNLTKTRNGSQRYDVEIIDSPEKPMLPEVKVMWQDYIVNYCKKQGIELKTQTHE